ncbi:hypothetical protein MSI_22930 [Treponema sp. JC4]|uniref:hypothetical protein n=1 Tax=Treponema sp. JC4 TaxID=1124982 RepID=UPI00025B05B1|nr:hypothetical protein [Treponema sp. JC4]EID84265.1 hypothetical protein MSI_22930 [Treponema sp. JC4]
MKKKLILILSILISNYLFANVEIALNGYGIPVNITNVESRESFSERFKQLNSFGMEHDISFFYGERASTFDAGLGIFWNVDFFHKISNYTVDIKGSGSKIGLGIGPVFRFTFETNFSIFLRPALAMNWRSFTASETAIKSIFDYSVLFDLNGGARYWFLNKTGFHLGVDLGFAFNVGRGFGTFNYYYKYYDVTLTGVETFDETVSSLRIYLGICFNFGDRGIDRF